MATFHNISISLLLVASLFAVSKSFPDWLIEPKWYATLVVACVCLFVEMALRLVRTSEGEYTLLGRFEVLATLTCGVQAVYGLSQSAGVVRFYGYLPAGSFENVAGFASCLCLSIPLGWRLFSSFSNWQKVAFIACKLSCVVAVFVSGSRTGALCIAALISIYLLYKRKNKAIWIVSAIVIAVVVYVMCVKTTSTQGRLFIWQRTLELIGQRPVTGWGVGGFDAHYMDMQADFFASKPKSEYAMLADNVRHPLNEFLLVCVDFGIMGLVVVLAAIAFVVTYFRRHPSRLGSVGMQVLACILVFSLSSYPFLYPFTWLMLTYSVFCVFRPCWHRMWSYVVLAVAPVLLLVVINRCNCLFELNRIEEKLPYGLSARLAPRLERLRPQMKTDYRYLYCYASCLFDAGQYSKACKVADECDVILSDYDLCLLKGDIYRYMRRYEQSIACYLRAENMCPSRFTPIYEVFLICRERQDKRNARRWAHKIMRKPVKVQSNNIVEMKQDAANYCRSP